MPAKASGPGGDKLPGLSKLFSVFLPTEISVEDWRNSNRQRAAETVPLGIKQMGWFLED